MFILYKLDTNFTTGFNGRLSQCLASLALVYCNIHYGSVSTNVSVYEKMMERMQEMGATVSRVKKTLADWAKRKGLQGNQNFLKRCMCTSLNNIASERCGVVCSLHEILI